MCPCVPLCAHFFTVSLKSAYCIHYCRDVLFTCYYAYCEICARLQVDPHCSYRASVEVSLSTASSRFVLVYGLQVLTLLHANGATCDELLNSKP